MHTFQNAFAIGLLLALGCASAVSAQQQPAQQQPPQQGASPEAPDQSAAPIPAYHSPLASQADNQQNTDNSQNLSPDSTPLTGAQKLSLGSPENSRSYWEPHIDVIATADSNAFGPNSGWATYGSILGGIDLHKISGNSDLTLSYVAGGILSNESEIGNSVIQQLNVAEKITKGRVVLSFLDNMDYLPEANLGYGYGGSALALPGGGALGIQPGLTPVDSVLTTQGQRIDNSFITEADVKLTRRSSFTLLGGYSLSHYFDQSLDLLNYGMSIAQVGYNTELTPKDTFGTFYRFSAIRYGSINQSINDNVVQLTYGRRLTGRLAFQIGAGPEYTTFSIPVFTSGSGNISSSQLNWSLSTSLTYQLKRGSIGVSYFHGVSAGSGVFAGANNDTLTGDISRQVSRTFTLGIFGGYASNRALAIPGFELFNQTYNYTFAGASLTHPFGRTTNASLSYEAEYQTANFGFCAGITCGTSVIAHLISVGFSWRGRPMLF